MLVVAGALIGAAGPADLPRAQDKSTLDAVPQRSGCGTRNPIPPDAFEKCAYPEPLRMGMFRYLNMSSYKWNAQDDLTSNRYFGLPLQHYIWDLFIRNEKGEWRLWFNAIRPDCPGFPEPGWPMNCDTASKGLVAFPWGPGAYRYGAQGAVDTDPRYKPWGGPASQTFLTDGRIKYQITSAGGPEEITVGPTRFEYVALGQPGPHDDSHIIGRRVASGQQWDFPWREPSGITNRMFYNLDGFSVEGTYLGERITGHAIQEKMWGTTPYMGWWVRNRVGTWANFFVDYENGDSEMGWIECGELGFRGALVTDQSGKEVANTPIINVYKRPGNKIEFVLGNGQRWVHTEDPSMRNSSAGIHFGTAERVGERRRIVKSTSVVQDQGGRLCPLKDAH